MTLPRIVELVGVAGAGKTTLAQALSRRNRQILICDQPYYRRAIYIPYFALHSLTMMPTFLRVLHRNDMIKLSPRLAVWMINLSGWHRILKWQVKLYNATCIMDRGPISMMAEILFHFPYALHDKFFAKWWGRMLSIWKASLDLVVWLDAEDQTLITRVRQRRGWHMIMDLSEEGAIMFTQTYRTIYQRLLSSIINNDDSRIISIDTKIKTFDEIQDQIYTALGFG